MNFYKFWVKIPSALGWICFICHLAARLDYANWLSSWMDLTISKVKSGGKHVDLLSGDRLINKAIWAAFLELFPSPSKTQNVISTHLNSQCKQQWLQTDEDLDGFCTSICPLWLLDNYFHRAVLTTWRKQVGSEGFVSFVFKSSVPGSGLAQGRYSVNVIQKIHVFNNNYFLNTYFIKKLSYIKIDFLVYRSMNFNTCIDFYNHHHKQNTEPFHHPQKPCCAFLL